MYIFKSDTIKAYYFGRIIMRLYQINKGKLAKIKEEPFKLERDLQRLVENNLETLMGLKLVRSEFSIRGRRFDTLAYSPKTKSFVIIEYKRDRHSGVFDQGVTYLNLLKEYQAAAVLELNNRFRKNFNVKNIAWEQSKILFISSAFTPNQLGTINHDPNIEMIEVKKYGKNLISLKVLQQGEDSTSHLMPTQSISIKNCKKTKNYTEKELLSKSSADIKNLYAQFKESIIKIDGKVKVLATQQYVAFKKNGSNVCDIEIYSKWLKVYLNAKWGKLNDPKKLFTNVSKIGHNGNGDYRAIVSDTKDIEYILSTLKQLL